MGFDQAETGVPPAPSPVRLGASVRVLLFSLPTVVEQLAVSHHGLETCVSEKRRYHDMALNTSARVFKILYHICGSDPTPRCAGKLHIADSTGHCSRSLAAAKGVQRVKPSVARYCLPEREGFGGLDLVVQPPRRCLYFLPMNGFHSQRCVNAND